MDSKENSGSDGFTLLEMLVGLILLAIIATMMVGAFQQMRPLKQIEKRHRGNIVAGILVDAVADDIGGALELSAARNGRQGPLDGDARRVEFAAVVRTGFRLEGLRDVKYALLADPAGVLHLERSTSLRAAKGKDVVVNKDDLFAGITDLKFRYLKVEKTGSLRWQESWTKESKLPRAIRVDIALRVQNRQGHASRIVYFGLPPLEAPQPEEPAEQPNEDKFGIDRQQQN